MNAGDFKLDLIRLFERYDEIDDDRLRDAAYQVVDYYGEDNMARKHSTRYDDEFDSENEENDDEDDEDDDDVIPSTGEERSKTPEELRG